jgi:hypothetical protein
MIVVGCDKVGLISVLRGSLGTSDLMADRRFAAEESVWNVCSSLVFVYLTRSANARGSCRPTAAQGFVA